MDTIRFIKTNKIYYDRIMLLFLKFFSVHRHSLAEVFSQKNLDKIMYELQRYLQEGKSTSMSNLTAASDTSPQPRSVTLSSRVTKHVSSILLAGYQKVLLSPQLDDEDDVMQLFLSHVQSSLLKDWEDGIV